MRYGLLSVSMLLVTISCIDQTDYQIHSAQLNPSEAVPLAVGNMAIQDFLKPEDTANVEITGDDLVHMVYTSELVSTDIHDLFSPISDIVVSQSFVVPAGSIPAHSKDIRSDSVTEFLDLGLSPAQLNAMDFKTGTISYSTNILPASAPLVYEVELSSPDLKSKSTGTTLFIRTNGPGTLPLSDYTATLNKNKFKLKIVVIRKKTSLSTHIQPNTSVKVDFSMTGIDFNTVHGFFGDQTVNPPSSQVTIGTFGPALNSATVSFAQPVMSFDVINEYGVPCKVTFVKLEARKNGSTLPLHISPASPVTIAVPANLGASATTHVTVTNAKQVMDFTPDEIFYQLSGRINQGLSSGNDFMADTSKMKVRLNVDIPMIGQASGIILQDTAKIDLSKLDESQIQKASLKIDGTNELPLDANVQIYLADEQYVVLDSIFSSSQTNLFPGSTVTAAGDLETAGALTQTVPLDTNKLNKIFHSKNLIIVARLKTSKDALGNARDVKFKSKYKLLVNIGLLADMNFTIKL